MLLVLLLLEVVLLLRVSPSPSLLRGRFSPGARAGGGGGGGGLGGLGVLSTPPLLLSPLALMSLLSTFVTLRGKSD